jgi:hypothetical protein
MSALANLSAPRSVPQHSLYRECVGGTTDGPVARGGTTWHHARKHWPDCVALDAAPNGTAEVVPHPVPPLPWAYPQLSRRVWYARESERTRRARPTLAAAQSTSSDVGITSAYAAQRNISARVGVHEPDPDVIDAIADAIADAIWADVYGAK